MRNLSTSGNRKSRFGKQALIVILVSLALIILGYFMRARLSGITVPTFAAASLSHTGALGFLGSFSAYFRGLEQLQSENTELKGKLSASEILVLDRNTLYEENIALKEKYGRDASVNMVLASVLMRPGQTPYDTLVIDIGTNKGISVGDRVTAGGSLLLGKVEEVWSKGSLVRLYSSPGVSISGFLRGTIPIEVKGQGGGSLRAEVPYDAKAVEGDTVSLPSIEPNIAFVVDYVEPGRGDSAAAAYLRLPVSPFELKFVEVWRSQN